MSNFGNDPNTFRRLARDNISICLFHFSLSVKITPKNFVSYCLINKVSCILIFKFEIFSLLKIIYEVLSRFRDNKFALNHSFITANSEFIIFSICCTDFPVKNKLVSSANIIVDNILEAKLRSLIYIWNRTGPKIDPWGTPHLIIASSDSQFAMVTHLSGSQIALKPAKSDSSNAIMLQFI